MPLASGEAGVPVVPTVGDGVFTLLWLVVALPALGALVLLVGGRRTDKWGHLLGCAMPIGSFVLGLVMFVQLLGRDHEERQVGQTLWTWLDVGDYTVQMGLLFDPLSALFVLLITGVGSLIHIYSVGYMAHDDRRRRFFGYLNLFVTAMLVLVLADDYLAVFLGWEGVGLASYLLIGFWAHKDSAATAANKAFVVNRVGDLGMSLAVMLMVATFGTSSFTGVSAGMPEASEAVATALGLLLLLAACGKSAQVPLQSWLLDAMEGPTPVSALIHAATMVTAGVYLVVRSNFIFELAPVAQTAVVIVGLVTLLVGAVIGCAKDDIKKALAGSTMSQIGYMMLAAGIGPAGYAFAIFHLLTHGFFKANMFLGAGSVMHATNDDVDMRHYGALRKAAPITFATFAFGYLAIIGFPGFSGFFSKDHIIEAAFGENWVYGVGALLGAGITAFYMTRVMLMTFFGERRWRPDVHPHESPAVMTTPLIVLAAGSLVGGVLILGDWIVEWLEPVVGPEEHHELFVPAIVLTGLIVLTVLVGVAVAWTRYGPSRTIADTAPTRVSFATRAARADLYGDAFNEAVFMRPGQRLTAALVYVDDVLIDGTVNALAALVGGTSGTARRLQTGFVRSYALTMLGGALLAIAATLAVTLS
ncbi:MAG TPA: NADH-quinone oxidoreductase subunit L [Nocardioidaceae bacterium]|nr:NADH-quinone oxidoreductase subunit L [Nocardioidaceae bacterium]